MEQYISKSAIIAEINKRIIDAPINNIGHQRVWAYNDVKDILNNLEVKEVDLEKETPNKELADEIDALSKRYPEVSFAKLSRIAVRIAKWQKEQDKKGE